MQELEKELIGFGECKGFNFEMIAERKGIGYIFMVSNDYKVYYEVFKHKETPVLIDFEKRIYSETETKVRYPKSKDFGLWAWTFSNHEKAQIKLNRLTTND